MAHRGPGFTERRSIDLTRVLVILGTAAAAVVVYLLYCLVVYSTVTP